jgi:arsenate reductase
MTEKILIICTGNSCRSQMAEGFLKALDPELLVFSAGTQPEKAVNPLAVRVMNEAGIDISGHYPKSVDQFIQHDIDYVITVCDSARESCPFFNGTVRKRLHMGFEDPALAKGTEEERLIVYRKIRDEIRGAFLSFYHKYLNPQE